MECAKVTAVVRKTKKKQVKDELDRIKQAEKKRRRLEKALATSAAIRSELEKKKLKKKEEQERLGEEGAAIAEAVALQVLLGEDSDDSSKVMLRKDEELISWDHARNIDIVVDGRQPLPHYSDRSKYLSANVGRASDTGQYGCMCDPWGNSYLMASSDHLGGSFYPQYFGEVWCPVGLSAGHLAAGAVSSLKIADDALADALVFNRMLRGALSTNDARNMV